jgi:hypothetical protein
MVRWLQFPVIGYVLYQLVTALRSERNSYAWQVAGGVRVKHFVANLPAQLLTVLTAAVLVQLPVFRWGWWTSIGGTGSIVLGQTGDGGWVSELVAVAMLLVLAAAIPVLAYGEEDLFRRGTEHRSALERLRSAGLFGIIHATMGIPLGVAVALTIAGLWFTNRYSVAYHDADMDRSAAPRDAGVANAARYHMAWNWSMGALVLVAVFAS